MIQYDPLIPDDPKRVLSHAYRVSSIKQIVSCPRSCISIDQVSKIRHIITSPAQLESTSLVVAYGLDLFSTRVTPSNTFDILSENFNKAQLVLTVAGLALAIVITKPMVMKKKLRERWYN